MESPFAGPNKAAVADNIRYAKLALADCINRGEAPWASHLLYTQVLDDTNPAQRACGLAMAQAWRCSADALVVYTDLGLSEGMKAGINDAQTLGIPIEYRQLAGED